MSSHSEEIWESFDALWRRVQQLSREVSALEARLGAIETEGAPSTAREFQPEVAASENGRKREINL
jgi:predicted transcriptional regulator